MAIQLKLTRGETILILRRRAGRSQREEGARYGVSDRQYSRWELDEVEFPRHLSTVGTLYRREIAMILRRRLGWTQTEAAERVGCCTLWIRRMERGYVDPAPLLKAVLEQS